MRSTARCADLLTQGQTRWGISPALTMPNLSVVRMLARSFLAGEPAVDAVVDRGSRLLGRSWLWLRPVAWQYVETFAGRTRPRHREVVRFLLDSDEFRSAWSRHYREMAVEQWLTGPQPMQPVAAAAEWDIPAIDSIGALAAWLQLTPSELDWFADLKGLGKKLDRPLLHHYHYRVLSKRSGAVRLIEAPKPRLKQLQRRILTGLLERIPQHSAVHGFRKGHSVQTFAAPHVGRRVVLRMDLQDFFPSFGGARIQAFFRTAGYPESVADLLGGICTNAAPRAVWSASAYEIDPAQLRAARHLYSFPHLPQGAPTSPALANLCTYRVDCRLAGLAHSADAVYTRYADDLVFSGGVAFERCVERFSAHAAAILMEEGFSVHHRKTRIMRQGVRQHVAGLVANERLNVMRADFDSLKAILTNCVRHRPASQNRHDHPHFRSHLEGRVAFVESVNPGRGARLRAIFDRIRWE